MCACRTSSVFIGEQLDIRRCPDNAHDDIRTTMTARLGLGKQEIIREPRDVPV